MKKADSEIPGSAFSFLLCYLPFLFFFPYHAPPILSLSPSSFPACVEQASASAATGFTRRSFPSPRLPIAAESQSFNPAGSRRPDESRMADGTGRNTLPAPIRPVPALPSPDPPCRNPTARKRPSGHAPPREGGPRLHSGLFRKIVVKQLVVGITGQMHGFHLPVKETAESLEVFACSGRKEDAR